MHTVFTFDYEPNYTSKGLFHITKNGKVGFVNEKKWKLS
jgi:hypothetical protein